MSGEWPEEEHEGDRYLQMLGLGHLADHTIMTGNGPIQARDFLQVCGEHARPVLIGFEAMDQNDPKYAVTKNALRDFIGRYIQGDSSS